jgi:hypothetical protein
MKCRFCNGDIYRVSNAQRKDGRHRWYRCYECDKSIHTIETYVTRGPVPGTPKKGPAAYGTRNGAAIFTEEDILRMRQLAADGVLQKDIAVLFGILPSSVSRIITRKAWKHI